VNYFILFNLVCVAGVMQAQYYNECMKKLLYYRAWAESTSQNKVRVSKITYYIHLRLL